MQFKVFRTSTHGFCQGTPVLPCEGSVFVERTYAFTDNLGGKWFRDTFIIDINSLEELIRLSNTYGEIIINAAGETIEIYDDYRE